MSTGADPPAADTMGRVTVLAERPTRPGNAMVPSDPDHEQRPLSVVVGLAGLGALLVGIVPLVGLAVLSWLTSTWNGSGGSAPDAMRVGMHLWLAGHRVPVELAWRPMTVSAARDHPSGAGDSLRGRHPDRPVRPDPRLA